MKKSALVMLVGSIAGLCAGPALADNLIKGWGVETFVDGFRNRLAMMSSVAEDGDQILPARLGIICMPGRFALVFSPRNLSFDDAVDVAFRLDGELATISFRKDVIDGLGKRLVADVPAGRKVMAYLLEGGAPLAWQEGDKSGQFSAAGFAATAHMLGLACEEAK